MASLDRKGRYNSELFFESAARKRPSGKISLQITAILACSKSGRARFVFSRVRPLLVLRLMGSRLPTISHEIAEGKLLVCQCQILNVR
jgi:hypothetical protein